MDKLIEDLNLTALERNSDNLTKVSLSPERQTSPFNLPINDDFYYLDGRLNHHLGKGRRFCVTLSAKVDKNVNGKVEINQR